MLLLSSQTILSFLNLILGGYVLLSKTRAGLGNNNISHKLTMKTFTILMLAMFILTSCDSTKTYINRVEDQKRSMELTDKFYEAVKHRDFKKLVTLFNFDPKAADYEKQKASLLSLLQYTAINYGEVKYKDLTTSESKIIKGKAVSGEYKIYYKVKRSKQKVFFKDSFTLVSDSKDIKINSFYITPIQP